MRIHTRTDDFLPHIMLNRPDRQLGSPSMRKPTRTQPDEKVGEQVNRVLRQKYIARVEPEDALALGALFERVRACGRPLPRDGWQPPARRT